MKRFPTINILLFILTCLSTLFAGALQLGIDPFASPERIMEGLPFAATLMAILLSHELGHYLTSRAHNTDASLPYFIPFPSIIGTMGAFIKMRSPILTRKALVDIGASGPFIGFVVSLVASIAGLAQSNIIMIEPSVAEDALTLGDSILFSALSHLIIGNVPEGSDVLLHPMAFAGWIGFFVTSLNLIPAGQLDGGHISFALLGEKHRRVGITMVVLLAGMALMYWPGWGIWAALLIAFGINHPPVVYWETPLDKTRQRMGIAALVVFILTFTPKPFSVW